MFPAFGWQAVQSVLYLVDICSSAEEHKVREPEMCFVSLVVEEGVTLDPCRLVFDIPQLLVARLPSQNCSLGLYYAWGQAGVRTPKQCPLVSVSFVWVEIPLESWVEAQGSFS